MSVGFQVNDYYYEIGHADFLHSFFSTICYRLEDGKWGKKYPYFMKKMYQGSLNWKDVKYAKRELKQIKKELKKFEPCKVVWDIEDLEKQPPWEENISKDITDLSNYFVTSDGKDLISVIFEVFKKAKTIKSKIEIR